MKPQKDGSKYLFKKKKKESNMLKKSEWYYLATIILIMAILLPGSALGEDTDTSLCLFGQVSPFLTGDAGSGPGAPDYDDAFDPGLGAGAELSWGVPGRYSLVTGIGYEAYNGDKHEGISFDDLEIVPIYIGVKLPIKPIPSRWNPYLRADIGAAHFSSVDVSYESLSGKYWESSWEFLFDVGGGVEYRLDQWGLLLDVRLRHLQKPDPAMGDASRAGSSITMPMSVGVNYHF